MDKIKIDLKSDIRIEAKLSFVELAILIVLSLLI